MSDPKLEIYNAINHIATEITTNLQQHIQYLDEAIKALDTLIQPIYNKNKELTETNKAETTVELSAMQALDGQTYSKMLETLQELHKELKQKKDQVDQVRDEIATQPLNENPELLKRCKTVSNNLVKQGLELDNTSKIFSKFIAHQALLFKSNPEKLDRDHAKKITDDLISKVQPIIQDVSNLKADLINTLNGKKEAAKDKKEIANDNVSNKPSSPKLGGRG